MTSTIQVTDLTPGQLHTVVAYVWVGDFLHVRLQAGTEQSEVLAPGDWRPVSLQFTPASTTETVTLVKHSGDGIAYLDVLTPVLAEYDGEPFDGNTPPRGRINYGWVGDENNSQSIARETPVTLTLLDTTPTVNGVNTYRVITESVDGATTTTETTLETNEGEYGYLSKGASFENIVRFRSNLKLSSKAGREQALVRAAGREGPIALFGEATDLQVSATFTLFPDDDATPEQVEALFRQTGRACFRDPTGRRIFGTLEGDTISRPSSLEAQFGFTITEAS